MLGNVPAPRDLPTAAATGELAALAPHVERIRAASASAFAPATRRAYGSSWAQFLAWADGEGLQALPAPPAAVAAYLAHRSEDGRSLATLCMDRQAIRAAHIEAGGPDPTASEGVRHVLRGLSRQRAGEGRRQAAALTWADVEFRSDGSGRLTVTRSKTDQEGEGAVQYLGRFAARALRRIRGTDPAGRVFGLRSGRPRVRAPLRPFRGSPPGRHGEGRRARGRVLRTLRPRRHDPRPCSARGKRRRRPGRRPLGFLQDARLLRTRRARRPWGRRPVIRGLKRPPR